MRRLGAVLLLVLLVAGMNVRSVWSGGGKWGSGTPSGARTDAYWLPDGQTPTGKPFPDVAIGGTLYTDSLQSASWTLGISDFLADLSPNTASLSFVGQVSGVPGDDVVITTGLGVQWVGRLDTVTQTRDTAGDWWTTITATDRLGALGSAQADASSLFGSTGRLDDVTDRLTAAAGVPVGTEVGSPSALAALDLSGIFSYTGTVLSAINQAAKASNAMMTTTRTGDVDIYVRETVAPSSVLTLSGLSSPSSWTLAYSIDVDINRWFNPGVSTTTPFDEDVADVALYGARDYFAGDADWFSSSDAHFDDWVAYGGSQRPTASGTMVVSDFTQDDLILLDPFQWVTESGTDWQVLSVQHSVTASPYSWTVSITADNLLDLL